METTLTEVGQSIEVKGSRLSQVSNMTLIISKHDTKTKTSISVYSIPRKYSQQSIAIKNAD